MLIVCLFGIYSRSEFELFAMMSRTHYILLLLSFVIAWKV